MSEKKQINQFHSGVTVGDAITNEMLFIRDVLQKRGYESEIYAEFIDPALKDTILPIKNYKGGDGNILIIHHSMGIGCFDYVASLLDKKIIVYHNITPEKFFDDEHTKKWIRIGLAQMRVYGKIADYFMADSAYNRKKMIEMGIKNEIDVLPISISLDRFEKIDANEEVINRFKESKNVLFVGRIVPNKCQIDLVRSFAVYHNHFNPQSNLIIVGDTGNQTYVQKINTLCEELDIKDSVHITGKVDEASLKAYYEVSSVFLSMSEHEGFGVPLLEAMKMGRPVIAYRSSAVSETLGQGGILFTEKRHDYVGTLINEVIEDKELRKNILERQGNRIKTIEGIQTESILFKAIEQLQNKSRKRTIQIQGPFESSYSLAIVNRKLIEAIDGIGKDDASIHCTEGPGDYEPNQDLLADKPHAKFLWEKSKSCAYPDVTIRNMYPPRVHDGIGGLNFQQFGWEESVIPELYVNNFNTYLDGIGTMSDYVTEKLIECGIKIPVKTMGIGVELCDGFEKLEKYPLKTKKSIKFLHISSALPRKGIDILLKVYFETFTNDDDVCLVLKTYPNIHNDIAERLEKLRSEYANAPEVEWYNDSNMPNEMLLGLYKACDCYVQVARGEGFGLPVAEAMLARVPVIVCANSGLKDFCNKDTALLVDYELVPAESHLQVDKNPKLSMWAEPDPKSLASQLKYFIQNKDSQEIKDKVEKAYNLIATEFTWKKVAERWLAFIDEVAAKKYKSKVAMVTTWNSKCGIAEYTKMEVEASSHYIDYEVYPNQCADLTHKDEDYVKERVWETGLNDNLTRLADAILKSPCEIVHIQHHPGLFSSLENFKCFIEKLVETKKVIITFHKTNDSETANGIYSLKTIIQTLNKCSALVVHQKDDVDRMLSYGIRNDLLKYISHGQIVFSETNPDFQKKFWGINSSLVVGSYGFLLPPKGIKETIRAIAILKKEVPDILYMPVCALHPNPSSKYLFEECKSEIESLALQNNVRMITDFLTNEDSIRYLQACDVMTTVYKMSQESASGAVRFCIGAFRPLVTTKLKIFDEFKDCAVQIDSADPEQIARGIKCALKKDVSARLVKNEKSFVKANSWYETAKKFYELYRSVEGFQ